MREEMYSEIVVKGAQPENDPETSCGLFSGHVIFCIFCRNLGQMFESWFGWLQEYLCYVFNSMEVHCFNVVDNQRSKKKLPRRQQVVKIGIQIHTLILYELIDGREMARLKHLGAFPFTSILPPGQRVFGFQNFEDKHPVQIFLVWPTVRKIENSACHVIVRFLIDLLGDFKLDQYRIFVYKIVVSNIFQTSQLKRFLF